jgi:hypothetical protein
VVKRYQKAILATRGGGMYSLKYMDVAALKNLKMALQVDYFLGKNLKYLKFLKYFYLKNL